MTEPQRVQMQNKEQRPSAIDASIGSRIRSRRLSLGLSQDQLGVAVGVTFQQIAKYESGINRVGACRLWDISLVLDVAISFFFEDTPPGGPDGLDGAASRRTGRQSDPPPGEAPGRPESLDSLEAYKTSPIR